MTCHTNYRGKHIILGYSALHFSLKGFRLQRNTIRQIQVIIVALKDANLTNNDIYLTYIDIRDTFGFIDHARLFTLMKDLGYPKDTIVLISSFYTNSTTSFHGNHFNGTPPIHTNKGMIQGNTLNPYLVIIFLDPLLWWLAKKTLNIILILPQPHVIPQPLPMIKPSSWTI